MGSTLEIAVLSDEAIKALKTELEWLNSGISHPDTTTWLFIHYITRARDPTLLDMAPSDIKERINAILSSFKLEGDRKSVV